MKKNYGGNTPIVPRKVMESAKSLAKAIDEDYPQDNQTGRESPILEAIKLLGNEIEFLNTQLDTMFTQLSPITRPEPQVANGRESGDKSGNSAVLDMLIGLRWRISDMTRRIESFGSCLDV